MKISTLKPKIFQRLEETFGVDWNSGVIVTYGDTVHCKSGHLSPDLIVHERTHINQQVTYGPEKWWERYLTDPEFRLLQELAAYKNQCSYIRSYVRSPYKKYELFQHIWTCMEKNYGDMITYEQAKKLLPVFKADENI